MEQHPVIGAEIVRGIEFLSEASRRGPLPSRALGRQAAIRTGSHREQIPLAARVFAVADVLDALTTDRPYRPASPLREAREMIVAVRHPFRPGVIEVFRSIDDEIFETIGRRMR